MAIIGGMNAFEIRKHMMENAKSIMDEADDRMSNNLDPITGERWEGDSRLFYLKYKTLLDWASKSNDPIPELPKDKDNEELPHVNRLQSIIDLMLENKIDFTTAEGMLKPAVAFMNALEKSQAQNKIDEINRMTNAARMAELHGMSDEELEKELAATRHRLNQIDDQEFSD